MQLVRFERGAVFRTLQHSGPECIFMLEGDALRKGQILIDGWVGVGEQGNVGEPLRSDKGRMAPLSCSAKRFAPCARQVIHSNRSRSSMAGVPAR